MAEKIDDDEAKLLQKAFSFGKWWGDTSSRKEKLYFETELKRRTALLDDVRRAYLKDVFAVRQQLEALQNGSKSAQPSPLPSLTMDLRMYGSVPQHFAKSFDELEKRGYLSLAGVAEKEMTEKEDLVDALETESIPLFGPTEAAFLTHHCDQCQGYVGLVFARNKRVSAALALISKHEKFVEDTKAKIAQIPGNYFELLLFIMDEERFINLHAIHLLVSTDLEKQAKSLREQIVDFSSKLGMKELKISELEDELSKQIKIAAEEKSSLEKKLNIAENVAARVPDLEKSIVDLTDRVSDFEKLAEVQKSVISAKENEISSHLAFISKAKKDTEDEIAVRNAEIAKLRVMLAEKTEQCFMMAEGELRFERMERIPTLQDTVTTLMKENGKMDETIRAQAKTLEDTQMQLALTKRAGEVLTQQLTETRADLAEALKPPVVRHQGIQVQPDTKEWGDTFQWSLHDKPKNNEVVICVSKSIASFSDLPPDHPQVVRQQTASCGSNVPIQATVEMIDKSDHCVLKTTREAELEGELEECEDALEKCEERLSQTQRELESKNITLKMSEMECSQCREELEDALTLVNVIEDETIERLNNKWKTQISMQKFCHKLEMNTQRKLTDNLAQLLNKMKLKVGVQNQFLGALADGTTKRAKLAEEKRTLQTPNHSGASTPAQSRPTSAKSETKVDILVVDAPINTAENNKTILEESDEEESEEDGGDNLHLTNTIEEDAANIQKFEAALKEKIEELSKRSKEADQEVAQLRFLIRVKIMELKTRSAKLLRTEVSAYSLLTYLDDVKNLTCILLHPNRQSCR